MKTPTVPVAMETQYGTLYIVVAAADEYSYHDTERGNVTDLRPVLWVCSDREFGDVRKSQSWTLRKRAYGVHYRLYREDRRHLLGADGMPMDVWHRSGYQPYEGKFRTDNGGEVTFGTATYKALWNAVTEAVDTFATRNPGWEALSRYLLHDANATREDGKGAAARQEAAACDAEADKHRVQRDGTRVPDTLLATIQY